MPPPPNEFSPVKLKEPLDIVPYPEILLTTDVPVLLYSLYETPLLDPEPISFIEVRLKEGALFATVENPIQKLVVNVFKEFVSAPFPRVTTPP